jgi:hypothetical protein
VGGPKPLNCTVISSGKWDCPVPGATVSWTQGDAKSGGTTDSNGLLKLQAIRDYRQDGSINIEAYKSTLSGSGSTNVVGCQNNIKKIYMQ